MSDAATFSPLNRTKLTSAALSLLMAYGGVMPIAVVAQTTEASSNTQSPPVSLDNVSSPDPTALIPPSPSRLPSETEYTLGPGDRLRMDVFQVPELTGEYQVLVDGTIGFPLIGNVNVEGKTIAELNSLLTKQYSRFVKRPVITVILTAARPLEITLSGEVNFPGAYTLPIEAGQKFPNVTTVIQQAGGLTPSADISQVEVRRQTGSYQESYRINLWELLRRGDKNQNITLRDGDVLVIPSAERTDEDQIREMTDANFGIRFEQEINVAVVGEVFRPGAYKLSPRDNVSNSQEVGGRAAGINQNNVGDVGVRRPVRLTQAIQQAGGIKSRADIRNVELRREKRNGDFEVLAINLWELLDEGNLDKDLILKDGDVITVPIAEKLSPEEFEAVATANFSPRSISVSVVGELRRPGTLQLQPNSTLNQAILAAGSFDPVRADQARVDLIRLNPDGTMIRKTIKPDFSQSISSEQNPTLRNNDVVLVNTSGLTMATDTLRELFSPIGALLGGGALTLFNVLDRN